MTETPTFQLALVHMDDKGVVSRPLIVLNLAAQDVDTAMAEARETARFHRSPGANALELVRHGTLVHQERFD